MPAACLQTLGETTAGESPHRDTKRHLVQFAVICPTLKGEAQENGTSKASRPHQNVAGTQVPQVLVSGSHLMHESTGYIFPDTTWPDAIHDRKWNLIVGI